MLMISSDSFQLIPFFFAGFTGFHSFRFWLISRTILLITSGSGRQQKIWVTAKKSNNSRRYFRVNYNEFLQRFQLFNVSFWLCKCTERVDLRARLGFSVTKGTSTKETHTKPSTIWESNKLLAIFDWWVVMESLWREGIFRFQTSFSEYIFQVLFTKFFNSHTYLQSV